MPVAQANDIEIHYETFGADDAEPLVLIMGLACQMLFWPEAFCERLASRGFRVIRFDNRDIGLSTKFDHAPVPNVFAAMAGDHSTVSYTIPDMAADTVGLLDALGIDAAHVVGQSMGGMIAQAVAIGYPHRVRSLTSISSTTGDPTVGQPHPEGLQAIMGSPAVDRDEFIDRSVVLWRTLGSPGFPFDEAEVRERTARCYDRSHDPMGTVRQFAGIVASPDRTPGLRDVRVPTLVVHGDADPLVDVSGGRATAEAVPGARLVVVPGMGHDLPAPVWDTVIDAIAGVAEQARSSA